jgi:hypothetical protein
MYGTVETIPGRWGPTVFVGASQIADYAEDFRGNSPSRGGFAPTP